jgi:hypothetical protein
MLSFLLGDQTIRSRDRLCGIVGEQRPRVLPVSIALWTIGSVRADLISAALASLFIAVLTANRACRAEVLRVHRAGRIH